MDSVNGYAETEMIMGLLVILFITKCNQSSEKRLYTAVFESASVHALKLFLVVDFVLKLEIRVYFHFLNLGMPEIFCHKMRPVVAVIWWVSRWDSHYGSFPDTGDFIARPAPAISSPSQAQLQTLPLH